MKFDDEICKGVSCHECSFNKGEDGCLLAERLDEIDITPESCEEHTETNSCDYQRAETHGWIPVSEALPEEKQDVLLAFKHNMVVGFWEDILNDGGQAWYANSGNGWFTGTEAVDDDGFPLAWMPLPEPYAERKEDE